MENISVFAIEQFILNKQYNEAAHGIITLFIGAREGKHFSITVDTHKTDPQLIAIYTRFAQCLCHLFMDHTYYKMDQPLFTLWLLYARELRAIFTISGYYRTDFLIQHFETHFKAALKQHQQGMDRLTDIEQLSYRLLLFSMLENNYAIDFKAFFKIAPDLTLAALLSLLSSMVVITPAGTAKREQLLGFTELFENYTIPSASHLLDVFVANMMSSYAVRRDKHAIKPYLNNSIKKWLVQENIIPKTPCKNYDPHISKPTLLIPLEFFCSWHSMGRSYGLAFQYLKTKFTLIALALRPEEIQDKNYAVFDEIIEFDCYSHANIIDSHKLQTQIKKIQQAQPDLIFYPSLGVHQAALLLGNMRLAPIQMISFGHPASSFCETIDYGIIEEDYAPEALDLFSEKMILLPKESFISVPLEQMRNFSPHQKPKREALHVAISTILGKLNANFMAVLKEIITQSRRKIIPLFFLNEAELSYLHCKNDILNMFPDAQVFYRLAIDSYLAHLSDCDFYLSTFPFGGANSIIDAMGVGLPIVCLRGEDIAGRTDSALIRRRGAPSWLVAHSEAEYITAALRLSANDQERLSISKNFLERSKELFPENNPNYQKRLQSFASACWHIHQHHLTLQHSSKRIFSLAELEETA